MNISIDVKFTNESIKNMSSAEFRSFAAKLESNVRILNSFFVHINTCRIDISWAGCQLIWFEIFIPGLEVHW